MARPLRIEYPGAWYHVMNRGIAKQPIFFDKLHRLFFISLLDELSETYDIEIHAYCLMGNHYHLLVHTPDGNLGRAMQPLHSRYAQYINRIIERDGALFRGRYKAILVQDNEYLLKLGTYIHQNPVEAGMVAHAAQYRWSSCRAYLGHKCDLKSLHQSVLMHHLLNMQSQSNYAAYLNNFHEPEIEHFYQAQRLKPIMGDKGFIKHISDRFKLDALSVLGRKKVQTISPSLDTLLSIVATYFNVSIQSILHSQAGRTNQPRLVALWACHHIGGYSHHMISEKFNGLSCSTISKAICKVRHDPELASHAMNVRGAGAEKTAKKVNSRPDP